MSKINFYSLGGLQEHGKNMYIVEVDSRLFILDCGIKHPTNEFYGVDVIEPDPTIVCNSSKVNGIFLTHAHDDHIGAVVSLLRKSNIPVFGSAFTIAVVKNLLAEANMDASAFTFYEVNEKTLLTFGNTKVRFFRVNHSIPEAIGIAIGTQDGYIVYTGNYNFDQNGGNLYYTSYERIVNIAREGVLLLLPESLGATESINREAINEFNHRLSTLFKHSTGRIIVSLFSNNLQRIQHIIDIACKFQKKIAIIGRKTQRLVNIAIKLGYLNVPADDLINLKYIDDKNYNCGNDTIVLVTGERHEPYFMLQRMAKRVDRLVHIQRDDTIIIMTKPFPGTEKMAARTLDLLFKVNDNVTIMPNKLLMSSNASKEETKTMINLLKPRYIIPVIGEYRHMYGAVKIAKDVGYSDEDVILLDNGLVASFHNGKYVGITKEHQPGEILIDGKGLSDLNDAVMRDRELLAESGFLVVAVTISLKEKKILSGPEIVAKGFMYIDSNDDLITETKEKVLQLTNRFFEGKKSLSDLRNEVRSEVSRQIYFHSKFSPMIVSVIHTID